MDMTRIAAQQKRLRYWNEVLKKGIQDEALKLRFVDTVKLFRNLLARAWERGELLEEDITRLNDLTRQIEQLEEESRLFAR